MARRNEAGARLGRGSVAKGRRDARRMEGARSPEDGIPVEGRVTKLGERRPRAVVEDAAGARRSAVLDVEEANPPRLVPGDV